MDPLAALFVRFAARGDVDALGEVFDRTAGRLLRLAMHLAATAEDAEDLLQATFVLAMKKADDFAPDQPLLPWLSGILAGEAKNLARKNARRRTDELPEVVAGDGGPADAAERRELVAQLRAHVEDLPGEQRQALLLQLQHGLSPASIAEVLDVPPGTVRMRLHRGLQALRKLLPAGLAVWLFGALGTRGLAAVRVAVMREAGALRATPLGGAAAIAAGAMTMKYVFAGVAVLIAAALCWWLAAPPEVVPVAVPPHGTAAAVTDTSAPSTAATPDRVAAASETIATPADGTGSLRIHVTSAGSARPIVDLAMRIWPGPDKRSVDGTARLVRTDAGGAVHVTALAPGEWQVEPLGFGAEATGVQVVVATEATHTIALAAQPLSGVVVDENGAPVAGASIRVGMSTAMGRFGADTSRPDVSLAAFVRTPAISAGDGTFACDAGDGETHVAAAHPSYASSHTQLTNARLAQWRLVLQPRTREVRGVVLDSSRQPIAGAAVEARVFELAQRTGDGTWLGPILVEFATTGADGRFVFGTLPPGNTRLEASAPGRRRATAGTAKRNDDLEIVLPDATEIVGTVREADGTPFHSGHVYVQHGANRALVAEAFVYGGRFRLRELPPPPFTVALYGDDSRMPVLDYQVASCDAAVPHVELVVPARPVLAGVVVDDGDRPLANWTVAACRSFSGVAPVVVAQVTTDADGRFALRHLRGDTFRVVATWPAGEPEKPAIACDGVSPLAGEIVLRVPAERMPRASVAGRFVDHTGNPMANAIVHLATEGTTRRVTVTDDSGSFRIGAIPAGTYALVLMSESQPRRTIRTLALALEQALELGDVQVLPVATLCVEIVQGDLTPWRTMLPDVWLQRPDDSIPEWRPSARDGNFVGAIEAGKVRIALTDPDLIAAPVDVELLPGERRAVQIPVAIGRSIALVFGGDGDPDTVKIDPKDTLHVEVADNCGAIVLRKEVRRSPHGDGNWTLEHTFAFGDYTVTARSDSGRRYRGSFAATDTMRDRGITVPRQP